MKEAFDIIGDTHGCADQLQSLLETLGYEKKRGIYRHASRRVIFLGDFIDRGPKQRSTLEIVRPMIESGAAQGVLGNHEFNAICYATKIGGEYIRPHTDKNAQQHSAFLRELPFGSDDHLEAIEWFKTLPVYLDLDGIGVVHACWCADSFAKLDQHFLPGRRLSDTALRLYGEKGNEIYDSLERILKGPEHPLPTDAWFNDKDGHLRSSARVKWWASPSLPMSRRLEFGGAPISDELCIRIDQTGEAAVHVPPEKPIFVGHYWLRGDPAPLSEKVACLDYSVAKGDKLVGYRWDGESIIDPQKFVWVDADRSTMET